MGNGWIKPLHCRRKLLPATLMNLLFSALISLILGIIVSLLATSFAASLNPMAMSLDVNYQLLLFAPSALFFVPLLLTMIENFSDPCLNLGLSVKKLGLILLIFINERQIKSYAIWSGLLFVIVFPLVAFSLALFLHIYDPIHLFALGLPLTLLEFFVGWVYGSLNYLHQIARRTLLWFFVTIIVLAYSYHSLIQFMMSTDQSNWTGMLLMPLATLLVSLDRMIQSGRELMRELPEVFELCANCTHIERFGLQGIAGWFQDIGSTLRNQWIKNKVLTSAWLLGFLLFSLLWLFVVVPKLLAFNERLTSWSPPNTFIRFSPPIFGLIFLVIAILGIIRFVKTLSGQNSDKWPKALELLSTSLLLLVLAVFLVFHRNISRMAWVLVILSATLGIAFLLQLLIAFRIWCRRKAEEYADRQPPQNI